MKSVGFATFSLFLFLGLANGASDGLANNGGKNPYNKGYDGGLGFMNSNGLRKYSNVPNKRGG